MRRPHLHSDPLPQEGYRPDRDIIVALETDEEILEQGCAWIQWLLRNHRELIDAEFALTKVARRTEDGKPVRNTGADQRKVSVSYALTVKNKAATARSGQGQCDFIGWRAGLTRFSTLSFPLKLRDDPAYFERTAQMEGGQLADDLRAYCRDNHPARHPLAASASTFFNAHCGRLRRTFSKRDRRSTPCRSAIAGSIAGHPGDPIAGVKARSTRAATTRSCDADRSADIDEPSALRDKSSARSPNCRPNLARRGGVADDESGATPGSYLRNAGIPTYGHSGLAGEVADRARARP